MSRMHAPIENCFGADYGSILIIPFISPKDLFTLCYVSKSIKNSIYNSPKRFSDHHAVQLIHLGATNFPIKYLPPISARHTVTKILIHYSNFTSPFINCYISLFPNLSTLVLRETNIQINILYMECVHDLTTIISKLPVTINRCIIEHINFNFIRNAVTRSIDKNPRFIDIQSHDSNTITLTNVIALKTPNKFQYPNGSKLRFLHTDQIHRNQDVLPNLKVFILEPNPILFMEPTEFAFLYFPSIVHARVAVSEIKDILHNPGSETLETLEIQLLGDTIEVLSDYRHIGDARFVLNVDSNDFKTFYNNNYTDLIEYIIIRYDIDKNNYPKLSNISLAWNGFKNYTETILDTDKNPLITFKFIPVSTDKIGEPCLDAIFSHLTGTSDELKEAQISEYLKTIN